MAVALGRTRVAALIASRADRSGVGSGRQVPVPVLRAGGSHHRRGLIRSPSKSGTDRQLRPMLRLLSRAMMAGGVVVVGLGRWTRCATPVGGSVLKADS